jgi:large subunit ribosomal protein L3
MPTKNLRLGFMAKKLGMTTIFDENGARVGVTAVEVGPNLVLQRKTPETDGYSALQIGSGRKRPKLVSKALAGHFQKAGLDPERFPRFVREVRLAPADVERFEPGQELSMSFFAPGDVVDVSGVSKGKGFQGVMKRHHFGGFPASHGTHEYFRHPGSIGCRTTPGRVHKGKRMAGQMGAENVTVQNLQIVRVLPEKRLLLIRGPIPGARGSMVFVQAAVKRPAKPVEAAIPQPA